MTGYGHHLGTSVSFAVPPWDIQWSSAFVKTAFALYGLLEFMELLWCDYQVIWNIKKSLRYINIFWLSGLSSDSAMTNELGSRFLLLFADFPSFVKASEEGGQWWAYGFSGSALLSSFWCVSGCKSLLWLSGSPTAKSLSGGMVYLVSEWSFTFGLSCLLVWFEVFVYGTY